MEQQTKTKTQSVTKTKMAIALLFLGAASLAAAGAGAKNFRRSRPLPDLTITRAQFENKPNSQHDKVRIVYKNIGKAKNYKAFELSLEFKDKAFLDGEVMVVDAMDYSLNSKEEVIFEFFVPKVTQNMIPGDKFDMMIEVDYPTSNKGVIAENKENNNQYALSVPKTELDEAPFEPPQTESSDVVEEGPPASEAGGLPGSEQPVVEEEVSFCAVTALEDPDICLTRLNEVPELNGNGAGILGQHGCEGVYKGMPIIRDANTGEYTTFTWDPAGFMFGYNLSACSLSGSQAKTVGIVQACIEELKSDFEDELLYVGEPECVDQANFCQATGEQACADRLADFPVISDSAAQSFLDSQNCAGVYNGLLIVESGGNYGAMQYDASAGLLIGQNFSGCSITNGGLADSFEQAADCIFEDLTSYESWPMYVDKAYCPSPERFCSALAELDESICAKRLKAQPGLDESAWQNTLNSYECADVYKGMPVIKLGPEQYTLLTWTPEDNFVQGFSMQACSLTGSGGHAKSPTMARNCIDQMRNTLSNEVLYNDSVCESTACAEKAYSQDPALDLCNGLQNNQGGTGIKYACFKPDGSFQTCTSAVIGCGNKLACPVF